MAVVGLTTRIDVADLLEKRVRSRCSQRQLLLPALTGADDCSRVLGAALSLPSLLTYSSAFAAKAKPFHTAWSANSAAVCASLATEAPQLTRRLSMGVTAGQLQTAVRPWDHGVWALGRAQRPPDSCSTSLYGWRPLSESRYRRRIGFPRPL